MKKIFIGCGVLALIVLGFLGYFAYQFVPMIQEAIAAFEELGTELIALEEEFPFDPAEVDQLDRDRFAAALDLRRTFADRLERSVSDFEEYGRTVDEEETGIFDIADVMGGAAQQFLPVLREIPARLREEQMAPSELAWSTRVLWAELRNIENGTRGDEFEMFEGRFDGFRGAYDVLRNRDDNDELPELDELIGSFDAHVLDAASEVLLADPQRVADGFSEPEIEVIYLSYSPDEFRRELAGEGGDGDGNWRVKVNGRTVVGGEQGDADTEDGAPPSDG